MLKVHSTALIGFAVAAAVAASVTPVVGRLARACGVVDHPDARKINRRPNIPLLGGLAIALGFGLGIATSLALGPSVPVPGRGLTLCRRSSPFPIRFGEQLEQVFKTGDFSDLHGPVPGVLFGLARFRAFGAPLRHLASARSQ